MSPDAMARDLGEVWADSGTPRRGQQLLDSGSRGPGVLAEAIWDYWDAVIAPHWPRVCGVLEGDVAHRLTRLVSGGLFGLIADLHPDVALDGHLLNIDKPHHVTARYTASGMTLVPSVFAWPTVILDDGVEGTFAITYPARGVGQLWEGLGEVTESDDNSLASLLGRTRAAVLGLTAVPMSTTAIAHELGQSPSTISQHLSVLREAGLVDARRSGKSVLYSQTPLAMSVVKAQAATVKSRPADRSRRMQVK
jgi:DNA-binding transcriptional ArsR family regulator